MKDVVLGLWALCSIVFFVVAYRGIKRSDEAMELNDIDWDAFFQESCEHLAQGALEPDYAYRARMKALRPAIKIHQVTELPKPMTPTWPTARDEAEPFHLDSEDSQPKLAS